MVIGLDFELVALVLPEGDSGAPIVSLDEDAVDAVGLHGVPFFSFCESRGARSAAATIADSDCSVSTAKCLTSRISPVGKYTLNCLMLWSAIIASILAF